jgi:phosphoenolpyruvate---glycerone phosphotransferase subunit DhaL
VTSSQFRDWIVRFADEMATHRTELTQLDTAIGDGDHGTNMDRGMRKAVERLETLENGDIGASLKAVGMALVSSVGGAAGPLYGTLFMQMGSATAGKSELDVAGFADALDAGLQGVRARGKAEPGDKTMVDALAPAIVALRAALEEGQPLDAAVAAAADAADAGARATVPMQARKGRASYLGERSVGHQDPGATSTAVIVRALGRALVPAG